MGRNDHRRLTPEEERLWRDAMAGIEKRTKGPGRRQGTKKAVKPAASGRRKPAEAAKSAPSAAETGQKSDQYRIPVPKSDYLIGKSVPEYDKMPVSPKGAMPGVDKRTAERFRRGRMAIDARIDLHGLTQDKAHRALNAFVAQAHGRGDRCVLVITGKGSVPQYEPKYADDGFMPDRSRGVLREMVPRWLNEPGNRAKILSISPAQPRDGGSGAFYVLLKRLRGMS